MEVSTCTDVPIMQEASKMCKGRAHGEKNRHSDRSQYTHAAVILISSF